MITAAGNTHDERFERILSLLVKYAQRDFSAREEISDKGDELDAIILGLNTLGEELSSEPGNS